MDKCGTTLIRFVLLFLYSGMKDMRTETPSVTEEMVRRLNAGEIDAFNDIYHATYVYLCCVAAYYVHSRQAATSVVNDVLPDSSQGIQD